MCEYNFHRLNYTYYWIVLQDNIFKVKIFMVFQKSTNFIKILLYSILTCGQTNLHANNILINISIGCLIEWVLTDNVNLWIPIEDYIVIKFLIYSVCYLTLLATLHNVVLLFTIQRASTHAQGPFWPNIIML